MPPARRSLKIAKIVKENDASELATRKKESIAASLYGVDIYTLRKWMIRSQRRLKKERKLDCYSNHKE